MADTTGRFGRHRARGRFNPLSEITQLATASAPPAVKSSAVLAAAGGLVAALALPAHGEHSASRATAAAGTTSVDDRMLDLAVSLHNQASVAPQHTFGVVRVSAVAKPVSRTTTRVALVKPKNTASVTVRHTTGVNVAARVYASSKAAAGGVVAIAKTLLGIPYVYGGSTPAGFDCSGFTRYVFAKIGISLPRTAAEQQAMATRVSNPQPGDLVFWGSPAYHVGIYAGNGMVIDSPRSGMVTQIRAIWGSPTYGRP